MGSCSSQKYRPPPRFVLWREVDVDTVPLNCRNFWTFRVHLLDSGPKLPAASSPAGANRSSTTLWNGADQSLCRKPWPFTRTGTYMVPSGKQEWERAVAFLNASQPSDGNGWRSCPRRMTSPDSLDHSQQKSFPKKEGSTGLTSLHCPAGLRRVPLCPNHQTSQDRRSVSPLCQAPCVAAPFAFVPGRAWA
jgi:hypothetical protein